MLGRRRRRRANIEPTLVQCPVFAGTVLSIPYNTLYAKARLQTRVDVLILPCQTLPLSTKSGPIRIRTLNLSLYISSRTEPVI